MIRSLSARVCVVLISGSLLGGSSLLAASPRKTGLSYAALVAKVQAAAPAEIYRPTPGSSHARHLRRLEGWVRAERRILVVYHPYLDKEMVGFYFSDIALILINARFPPNGRLEALLHEVAHDLTPKHGTFIIREHRELFAELVGVLAASQAGLDTTKQGVTYMAQYKAFLPALDQHQPAIEAAATRLADVLRGVVSSSRQPDKGARPIPGRRDQNSRPVNQP